jgi:two-component system, cell cycle sensor histidine kinase and response regulator CckA
VTRARILIVEDERIVQLDLEQRLKRMGHTVVGTAARGDEAITKAREHKPDLVIMDVQLDGEMDGIEAARQIRGELGTPVIYATAYAPALQDGSRQDIFGPCLSKPFTTVELKSAIATTLAGSRPESADTREQ